MVGLSLFSWETEAQGTPCCENIPLMHPTNPRFPQGASVTLYIDSSSGFTETEMQMIKEGAEDWNGELNSSHITHNVVIPSTPPYVGGNNTIVARFNDNHSNSSVAALIMSRSSNPDSVYGQIVFNRNIRVPERRRHWRLATGIYERNCEA